jgi:hypothetical protein
MNIHFRIEEPNTIQYLMRRGDWMTSLDLKNAFNHLAVTAEMQRFLCFRYRGQ